MDEKQRKVPRHVDPYRQKPAAGDDDGYGELVEGRNAVTEALRAGIPLDKVYIAKGDTDAALAHIAAKARDAGAVVVDADRRRLDALSVTHAHQGVVALTSSAPYVSIEDILSRARERGEEPLIAVCDEISDPHNLGAIIRTAEAAGLHGVIIPKRRSAGLTAIVAKTSAGASFHLPVARVPNLTAALGELKKAGLWIFGASPDGTLPLWDADLRGAAAIVIGSEGDGIGRLVRENCDFLVSIPMTGKISSLNASVSAAVLMYEAVRQRYGR
ncbi:MAG: 23S rRNA (guanosine(2251)-2'-O)-methyltransferase RlmB [Oscillospiraceae bacterium]|jgi:23S rRNA (guanosine2251-2'-O)-methyltransferase|nr:23S rRNA (guanosine(2251)-2'-O)-methyltransferase RlmB [Oscillospiraceae bacterium]